MRIALVLAAAVVFAAAPSAQSVSLDADVAVQVVEEAPVAQPAVLASAVEAAPELTPAADLSAHVADAPVDFEPSEERRGADAFETVMYVGSMAGTAVALAYMASLFM